MLFAISPIDGRYHSKTEVLSEYFSEYALIKFRVYVEIEYFKALQNIGLSQLSSFSEGRFSDLDQIVDTFSADDAEAIKKIEKVTNHDVKAVEYFLKEKFEELGLSAFKEFIHFGLTSQDVNNTAFPLMLKGALQEYMIPSLRSLIINLEEKAAEYHAIPMLARTHGQPASPTTLGKEFEVFIERLQDQVLQLSTMPIKAKFGGATGNFNAHKVTYPDINWPNFANEFVAGLGLVRSQKTTQIAHYDHIATICHVFQRINTILIDFCRDIWTYISMEYFTQRVVATEVGSSAMPHKVNPIDFENAEGNLGMANAIFQHLAEKLPISRLQRDLTDSTVLRNLGVPFAHSLISIFSINKGLDKLLINKKALDADLDRNWAVVAEAIQSILRREQFEQPYEALKNLTRGKSSITQKDIQEFIEQLNVTTEVKEELHAISPFNYVGYY